MAPNEKGEMVITLKRNWHGRTMVPNFFVNKNQKKWIGFNDPNIFHLIFHIHGL